MGDAQPGGPGHETRDVDFAGIFGVAGVTIVLGVAVLFGVWWLFQDLRERQKLRMPAANPLTLEQNGRLPQPLQLEGIEGMNQHIAEAKPAATERPNRYGWVDRKAGVVRVPMDRALTLIIDQKLVPSTPGPAFPNVRDPYATLPIPANSGRGAPQEQP